jgi:mannose-6-phosphate isomerase-like protein (cupin superfamily)
MNVANIHQTRSWFEVLQTTDRSQTAVMILFSGGNSSEKMNVHQKSDQALLLVEGKLEAEVDGKTFTMVSSDTCIVPAGTPHRFQNRGKIDALTFNVYSPPEYSPNEKG